MTTAIQVIAWVVVLIGAVAFALGRWIIRRFGHVSLDQALMNLDGAGEGAGGSFIREAIINVLLIPSLAVLVLAVGYFFLRARLSRGNAVSRRRVLIVLPVTAVLLVPALGAWSLGSAVQVRQYWQSRDSSLDIGPYYVSPELVADQGNTKTSNLVLIYLESMENTFSDADLFGVNMLQPVEESTESWDQIDSLYQYPGGGWTMAGIVSTQCGIPLRMPPSGGDRGTETLEHSTDLNKISTAAYLPGATCLGDVLAAQGYNTVYMGGASGTYASKEQYYREHGYQQFLGREHWEEEGETEIAPSWGLSDRRLFENAKSVLTDLEESGEPFALTMLTLDSHEPATIFPSCQALSSHPLVDATRCSMGEVAGFVNFMKTNGYLENTTVVVMGDHLKFTATEESMGADFTNYPNRTIFNRIYSTRDDLQVSDVASQLDMYPTILEAMGFSLREGRAGLGTSAYSQARPEGSLGALSDDEQERLIRSRSSDFYSQMWGEK